MPGPEIQVGVIEVLRLRFAGLSWPAIARSMRLGQGTVYSSLSEGD